MCYRRLVIGINSLPLIAIETMERLGTRLAFGKKAVSGNVSEMNITGTLPQAGNLKLFVSSLSTQSSTRPEQNIFNVVLMRPDKTE